MSRLRRKKVEAEDKSDIDLTPMLDVVFIMLIFFIVTASFVKEKTLPINTPEKDNDEQVQSTDSSNILIEVLSNNDIKIDNRKVDIRSVKSLVATKKAAAPNASVVIRAHELSNAETYVAIMDASREAKVRNVALIPYNDKAR